MYDNQVLNAGAPEEETHALSKRVIFLMAAVCGITVANLYYIQPLLAKIAEDIGVSQAKMGIAAMLTQAGYAAGLLLLVPLGDIRERRNLVIQTLRVATIVLLVMAFSFNYGMVLAASFAIGFASITPQLIVPFAAHLAKPEERSKVIGTVMSGLLIGILLSRTFSGFIGDAFGWRVVYYIAAFFMLALSLMLSRLLPLSPPTIHMPYKNLLTSMWGLIKREPVLRESMINGALMFGAFSAFWTCLVFFLETPVYNWGAKEAGMFGLAGVAGALAAPIVGRLADKKNPRFTVGIGVTLSFISYLFFFAEGHALWGMVVGVILIDLGNQTGQISNQSRINALHGEARSRINTVYMVCYFIGGALGSFFGAYSWGLWGWAGVCVTGLILLTSALVIHFVFYKPKS